MGRYIAIYYGSFMHVYGGLSSKALKDKLDHTLKHGCFAFLCRVEKPTIEIVTKTSYNENI
jgi:hypothetical protein